MDEPSRIGDWRRISVLGSGGFGVVVLWECSEKNDYIAIKKCNRATGNMLTSRQRERWENEVQIMKMLNHPNIVKYKPLPEQLLESLSKFNPTKLPLLSMEYCRKGNLRHVLGQPKNLCGLPESIFCNILLDITGAVAYLHSQSITHRDIKPDNIVLQHSTERKDNTIYKLIDLGYAKELNDCNVSFVGTLFYLAPEIFSAQMYDSSVDYWSLGVLAFEVICGVLPFSPYLTPVERYKYIKEKGPEDICIYESRMGNIKYSSQLLKENHISSCLKEHIEVWLRHVLRFNPTSRAKLFPNSQNVFQYLMSTLRKKIVVVFSIYKYEFYSYEFDEFTLLSTLQHWIFRDTKIAEEDQILLSKCHLNNVEKHEFIKDCLAEDNFNIYLFKKGELFNKHTYTFPRMVKYMFDKASETFNWRTIKLIFSQSILYICQDINHGKAFVEAISLLNKYSTFLAERLNIDGLELKEEVLKLINKIQSSNELKLIGVEKLRGNPNIQDCLLKYQRILSGIERCLTRESEITTQINFSIRRAEQLHEISLNVCKLVELDLLEKLSNDACDLFKKTSSHWVENNNNISCRDMFKIISNAIRIKDKLFSNKYVSFYVTYVVKFIQTTDASNTWMQGFISHIEELSESLNNVDNELTKIMNTAPSTEENPKDMLPSEGFNVQDAIQENQELRITFEKILTNSILDHKTYSNEANFYLNAM